MTPDALNRCSFTVTFYYSAVLYSTVPLLVNSSTVHEAVCVLTALAMSVPFFVLVFAKTPKSHLMHHTFTDFYIHKQVAIAQKAVSQFNIFSVHICDSMKCSRLGYTAL